MTLALLSFFLCSWPKMKVRHWMKTEGKAQWIGGGGQIRRTPQYKGHLAGEESDPGQFGLTTLFMSKRDRRRCASQVCSEFTRTNQLERGYNQGLCQESKYTHGRFVRHSSDPRFRRFRTACIATFHAQPPDLHSARGRSKYMIFRAMRQVPDRVVYDKCLWYDKPLYYSKNFERKKTWWKSRKGYTKQKNPDWQKNMYILLGLVSQGIRI